MDTLSIAELVPAAVGIALNPPAIIAVILMLSSAHPRRNATAFVAGWMVGILVAGLVVLLMGESATRSGPGTAGLWARLLLGVGLLYLAARAWSKHRAGGPAETPAWMASVKEFSAPRSFGVAALFAALNPKTLALNAAGVLIISEAALGLPVEVAWLLGFVVLSSVTVAAPLVLYLVAPAASTQVLDRTMEWLLRNTSLVTALLLGVIGVIVMAGAAQGLMGG